MPLHMAEAGETVLKRKMLCEGSAVQNGTALLLISFTADARPFYRLANVSIICEVSKE